MAQFLLAITDFHDNINPLKPSGNYMYHLLQQSVTLHFVFMYLYHSHCK
jgi:hypothetical protein